MNAKTPLRVHTFNPFFYPILAKHGSVNVTSLSSFHIETFSRYDAVRSWTKSDDIFEKEFIIIPIHAQ